MLAAAATPAAAVFGLAGRAVELLRDIEDELRDNAGDEADDDDEQDAEEGAGEVALSADEVDGRDAEAATAGAATEDACRFASGVPLRSLSPSPASPCARASLLPVLSWSSSSTTVLVRDRVRLRALWPGSSSVYSAR